MMCNSLTSTDVLLQLCIWWFIIYFRIKINFNVVCVPFRKDACCKARPLKTRFLYSPRMLAENADFLGAMN